ncbi:hypothetical protein Taro_024938, partial [Colocasia esculenta]|nr:hypothetical protein [Colocasia esculenta]
MDLQLCVCRLGIGLISHEVCSGVGTVVIVVSEWRLTGCGLLCVECPSLAHVLRFCRGGVPCVALIVVWLCFVVVPRSGVEVELCSVKVE